MPASGFSRGIWRFGSFYRPAGPKVEPVFPEPCCKPFSTSPALPVQLLNSPEGLTHGGIKQAGVRIWRHPACGRPKRSNKPESGIHRLDVPRQPRAGRDYSSTPHPRARVKPSSLRGRPQGQSAQGRTVSEQARLRDCHLPGNDIQENPDEPTAWVHRFQGMITSAKSASYVGSTSNACGVCASTSSSGASSSNCP